MGIHQLQPGTRLGKSAAGGSTGDGRAAAIAFFAALGNRARAAAGKANAAPPTSISAIVDTGVPIVRILTGHAAKRAAEAMAGTTLRRPPPRRR